jgi:hypothetical protein
MKGRVTVVLVLIAGALYYYSQSRIEGPTVTAEDGKLVVNAGDLAGYLQPQRAFSSTVMLFGGTVVPHRNAISPVLVAGLGIDHARSIYSRYPDFYRCNSPGAAMAKPLVVDINMIPADARPLREVAAAVEEFHRNLRAGGDRVCVSLRGHITTLVSVKVREHGVDITDKFPAKRYYFVTDAERIECRDALEQI